jgi:membrane fusion protein (multidrug efflux system)
MTTAAADTKGIEAPLPERTPTLAEAKPRSKGKRAWLVLAVLVALLGIGYAMFTAMTRGRVSTDDAQVEADVVPVGARVAGQVVAVPVAENQHVKKGDLLLRIDDADYIAKVNEAEADLAQAQAQEEQAESQEQIVSATAKGGMSSAQASVWGSSASVRSAESQIIAERAALARAEIEAKNADTELARARELRAANAIAQAQLDAAQTAADAAHAALAQAVANLDNAAQAKTGAVSRVAEAQGRLTQSAPIDAQMRAARAATAFARAHVTSMQAALRLAKLQLEYTKVNSPEDGWVSKLMAHPGQLLSAASPIAELVPDKTYVVANFKEIQIGEMRPGQEADVSIDAFSGRTLHGKVESISAGTGARFSLLPPDNASGNFVKVVQRVPVRIAFTELPADVILRAGLSADVTVRVK